MNTPSIWMIGDIQGCDEALCALLDHPSIAQDPQARFWIAGDLINRGPSSLATIRRIMAMQDRCEVVLGNHDLHFLAVAAGVRHLGKNDTIQPLLDAPDAAEIIEWLRHQKLAHLENDHLMVHAGVLPCWGPKKTRRLAAEVEAALQAPNWKETLSGVFGNEPDHWKKGLTGAKRLRVIINALTRLRMCTPDARMALSVKSGPQAHSDTLIPWFDMPNRKTSTVTMVFGHWSTLGLYLRPDVIGLDTGCVWGGQLTAIRQHDRLVVQIPCQAHRDPFAVAD
ncbi:symmetrical bis(5'-nucleosyl)-tetraphosphatase [Orrella sp. 11846]|uniref:symmetrical bis(5'-nucleosyl)-tetraphosphatase n=1 Tax=Orrella sp. 11846 TaxID=3409913 RepID=UPI003B58CB33